MIEVRCPCGQPLGRFEPWEDHSGVVAECPKCKKELFISNGFMNEVDENPEDYNNPKFIVADEA